MTSAASVVYGLTADGSAARSLTYAGVTDDMRHRLRQHNGAIKGGARSTKRSKAWRLMFLVRGLPDRRTCLQLEWRLHRRHGSGHVQLIRQLQRSFAMERFTSKAPPVADLAGVRIEWHDAECFRVASTMAWPAHIALSLHAHGNGTPCTDC